MSQFAVCDYCLLVSSDLVTIVATHQHQGHPLTFSSSVASGQSPSRGSGGSWQLSSQPLASPRVRHQCGPAAGTVNSRQEADGSGDEDSDSGQSGLCASCLALNDRATRKY